MNKLENSANAYQRLLVKAHCTSDECYGVSLKMLSAEGRVNFLMRQIEDLRIKGYSRKYVSQLVNKI